MSLRWLGGGSKVESKQRGRNLHQESVAQAAGGCQSGHARKHQAPALRPAPERSCSLCTPEAI